MQTPLVTNQIELSLAAHDAFVNGDVARHQMDEVPLMAWSPLAGGALFSDDAAHTALRAELANVAGEHGSDPATIAVAWLLAHPARIMPVMGTNTIDRIKKLSAALDIQMDRVTWYRLYTAALGREVA